MTTKLKLMTAEELLQMPDDDMKRELIRGVVTEDMPPGYEHGVVEFRIGRLLGNFVDDNDFGEILGGDSGFILERGPDTVRGPDVAWVAPGRIEGRSGASRNWLPTWWWKCGRPTTPGGTWWRER